MFDKPENYDTFTIEEIGQELDTQFDIISTYESRIRTLSRIELEIHNKGASKQLMNTFESLFPECASDNSLPSTYTVESSDVNIGCALESLEEAWNTIINVLLKAMFVIVPLLLAYIGKLIYDRFQNEKADIENGAERVLKAEKERAGKPDMKQMGVSTDTSESKEKEFFETFATELDEVIITNKKKIYSDPLELSKTINTLIQMFKVDVKKTETIYEGIKAIGESGSFGGTLNGQLADIYNHTVFENLHLVKYSLKPFFEKIKEENSPYECAEVKEASPEVEVRNPELKEMWNFKVERKDGKEAALLTLSNPYTVLSKHPKSAKELFGDNILAAVNKIPKVAKDKLKYSLQTLTGELNNCDAEVTKLGKLVKDIMENKAEKIKNVREDKLAKTDAYKGNENQIIWPELGASNGRTSKEFPSLLLTTSFLSDRLSVIKMYGRMVRDCLNLLVRMDDMNLKFNHYIAAREHEDSLYWQAYKAKTKSKDE